MFEWFFAPRCKIKIDVYGLSERGLVRPENQDNFFIDPKFASYCVADGIGGGEGGAKASELVCKAMEKAAFRYSCFASLMKRSSDAILEANAAIREYAKSRSWRQMGTTLAALFINHERAEEAVIAHVGDSRIYRARANELELLTIDHTLAGEIGRRSSLKALGDEIEKRAGRLSHVLTRAVGIEKDVFPEWRKIDIKKGDVYLICSDGVYDMINPAELKRALTKDVSAKEIAGELSRLALDGGALDNYTAIILKIGGPK